MTPSQAGGKPGGTLPRKKIPGISFRSAAKYHNAPWQLRLYRSGKESYSYHKTEEDAVKAKAKADRLRAREGSRAFAYDRAAQLEYEEAKRIVGPGANLIEIARQAALRASSARRTVILNEAVDEYLAKKIMLNRSRKHVQDIRQISPDWCTL